MVIFFKTDSDLQRLRADGRLAAIESRYRQCLTDAHYQSERFSVLLEFESHENVVNNYEGSYFYRMTSPCQATSRTMQPNTQVLRPKAGVRALCVAIYLAGVVLLIVHLPFDIPDHHKIWIVPCYAIFGAFWLADVFLTRIILGNDSLRIVSISDFQSRIIPRAEIDSVTWAKGCGAALTLRDGRGVRLPSAGRNAQGLSNTIRAWLKRTEV